MMSLFKLVLAGFLVLPCMLVTVVAAPIIAILSIPSLLLLIFRKQDNHFLSNGRTVHDYGENNKQPDHVIVVGGSSGIGLSIAKECVKRGISKVTILARNQKKLDQAYCDIHSSSKNTNANIISTEVRVASVSVSDYTALEKAAHQIFDTQSNNPTKQKERVILFNCAGIPYTSEFQNIPTDVYSQLVETNLLGAMYVTRAFLPYIDHGCIVFCSSAAGQVGVYGYTVYASTKYALRGYAESLHAELIRNKPNVSVQVAFPVDTATPGHETEKAMMPDITKLLNANAGLSQPEDVATIMVNEAFAKNPRFQVYFTFEGWMLSNLTAGMSPVANLSDAVAQVAFSGLFRLVSLFYSNDFWRIIRNYPHPPPVYTTTTMENTTSSKDGSKVD